METKQPIKLFVDDLRSAPDDSWVVARTVTEAIRLLDTQDVAWVALDHDICHALPSASGIYSPLSCAETFEPVARHIAALASERCERCDDCRRVPRVTIHTSNPAGAERMRGILAAAGIEAQVRIGRAPEAGEP